MNKTLSLGITLLCISNALAMTQSEFVERLTNTHPFFTQQGLDQQVSQLNYTASTANQDWVLGSSLDSKNQLNNQISSGSISATHNLVDTGADVSITNTWTDATTSDQFLVNYTQPLLKDFGGINDRLSSDLLRIKTEINSLKLKQSEEAFVLSQLFKLLDLSNAQQQLSLAASRLKLADQELKLVKDKFAQSVVDKVDVLLQKDAYQRAYQQHLQAEQDLDLLKQELAITLDMPAKSMVSDYDLYQLYHSNVDDLPKYLKIHTTEMQTAKLEQAVLIRQLNSDKNNTQLQLDLKLGAGYDTDDIWNVGLGLSYPLGNTKAKSALEKTQIELMKAKENAAELLLKLTVKASVLEKKVAHLAKLLSSYQARIEIAKSRAQEEKRRYELGNSPVSFVISAQNNVQEVRSNYAQAALSYQKSVLEFQAAIDQLL
ncbi:TolC family protein [uncultured Candidatus Thioglobus sp.]|jgi:outer membrane protein TolC|uniref:TolC family protein n=1 Tax=uncultured Candidatus Thioglobus sp. TaxID=655186 RepID=UPI001DDFDA22|nr:TolC family protein [Candidatus Thioglobus sp.]MBT4000744.1 TolC family protein [Candidatus Thioglobus sp.]MBT4422660.1 TolC family protein [Candidatus Thioglobus sp.]MBT4746430.1 TolC family protein [Candidatus Thioglobus sp.]MBT5165423.1 TolC family protein [Candidatus Thioglobus sp.]